MANSPPFDRRERASGPHRLGPGHRFIREERLRRHFQALSIVRTIHWKTRSLERGGTHGGQRTNHPSGEVSNWCAIDREACVAAGLR